MTRHYRTEYRSRTVAGGIHRCFDSQPTVAPVAVDANAKGYDGPGWYLVIPRQHSDPQGYTVYPRVYGPFDDERDANGAGREICGLTLPVQSEWAGCDPFAHEGDL